MCIFCSLASVDSGSLGCRDLPNPTDLGAADATGASDAGTGAAPAFSLAQIVQQLRTQWGGSFEGTTESWSGSGAINYYVGGAPFSTAEEGAYKVNMTALMTSRATLAFELWDDLIARDLNPVSSAASGQIQFEYASRTYNGSSVLATNGGTYSRSSFNSNGTNSYGTANYATTRDEIWLNRSWTSHDQDNDMYFGGYGFQTYMHEIGHSLGLSHPGTYNAGNGGTITFANSAEYSQDNRQYTIMSYFGGYSTTAGWQQEGTSTNYLYSSTPMLHDVAAIQAIYGADMNTRTGDTTYGFHVSVGVPDVFNFAVDTTPIVTVWDAGGNDTLDLSGYSASQRIDLHAGTYSDVGGMLSNFAIAYNVAIENAVGGSGNDTIVGNDANNTLKGGSGNDSVDGGAGIDSAVFSGVRAAYTLTALGGSGVRVAGPDGADTLTNVERLVFDDEMISWPLPAPPPAPPPPPPPPSPPPPPPPGPPDLDANQATDFNGDAHSDILLQNIKTGGAYILEMNGTTLVGNGAVGWAPGAAWQAKDTGDFNGDGKADILLQDTNTGDCYIWELNGTSLVGNGAVGWTPGAAWQAKDGGDFNGDGRADVLLQNVNTGACYIWELNGTSLVSHGTAGWAPGAVWQAKATGDFNGDGKSDIVLQNVNTGDCYIWMMNGTSLVGNGAVGWAPGAAWQVKTAGDYNGDGKSDILLQNANTGDCYIWELNGTSLVGNGAAGWTPGAAWQAKDGGDFNGDGKSDILLQNVNTGDAYMWLMNGTSLIGNGPAGWSPGADWHIL